MQNCKNSQSDHQSGWHLNLPPALLAGWYDRREERWNVSQHVKYSDWHHCNIPHWDHITIWRLSDSVISRINSSSYLSAEKGYALCNLENTIPNISVFDIHTINVCFISENISVFKRFWKGGGSLDWQVFTYRISIKLNAPITTLYLRSVLTLTTKISWTRVVDKTV